MLRMCHSRATALAAVALLPASALAEITVISDGTLPGGWLSPFSLAIGGSIRQEIIHDDGPEAGYQRNGHDGGSRFRFTANYALRPDTHFVGYYELGVDVEHLLGMRRHYAHGSPRDTQRQLYGGLSNTRYGQLTFGHQYSAYYDAIGVKSDVWDNDGHASANWIGVGGDYDGGERPRNALKYRNRWGDITLYADYLLPQDSYAPEGSPAYRRHRGFGLGMDYALRPDLTLSAALDSNHITLSDGQGGRRSYNQQYHGVALTWQPGAWYLVGTATAYRHYVPDWRGGSTAHYFAGKGYGLEAFGGYTFTTDRPWLHSIQPYLAADTLQLGGQRSLRTSHLFTGVYTQLTSGFSFYLEHTFVHSNSHERGTSWLSVYYDF